MKVLLMSVPQVAASREDQHRGERHDRMVMWKPEILFGLGLEEID